MFHDKPTSYWGTPIYGNPHMKAGQLQSLGWKIQGDLDEAQELQELFLSALRCRESERCLGARVLTKDMDDRHMEVS